MSISGKHVEEGDMIALAHDPTPLIVVRLVTAAGSVFEVTTPKGVRKKVTINDEYTVFPQPEED